MQNNIKRILKEIFKLKILIIVVACVTIFLMLFSSFAYLLKLIDGVNANNGNIGFGDNTSTNMPAQIENQITSSITSANIIYNENGNYKLNIDLDEKIDEIYNNLIKTEKGNRTLSYLTGTEEEKKEYLKNMVKAEIITQYPDFRKKENFNNPLETDEVQGVIQIKRTLSDSIKKVSSIEKSTNTLLTLYGIVCWGDENTLGNPEQETESYPSKLAEMLDKSVYNLGFDGEKAEEIMLRAGVEGYTFEVTEEFEIGSEAGSQIEFSAQIKVDRK